MGMSVGRDKRRKRLVEEYYGVRCVVMAKLSEVFERAYLAAAEPDFEDHLSAFLAERDRILDRLS